MEVSNCLTRLIEPRGSEGCPSRLKYLNSVGIPSNDAFVSWATSSACASPLSSSFGGLRR